MRICASLPLLLGVLFLLPLAGCDGAGDERPARVRVVHAASAAGAVDFFIDFDLFTRDLTFRDASPYVEWEAGIRLLEARTTRDGQAITASREVLLDEGQAYTVLIAGTEDAASIILLTDDRSTPPTDLAQLRVAHAAQQVAAIDAVVTPESGGDPVLDTSSLAFGTATEPETVLVGTYEVLASSGTDNAGHTVELETGRRYLAVVAHVGTTSALSVFAVEDG